MGCLKEGLIEAFLEPTMNSPVKCRVCAKPLMRLQRPGFLKALYRCECGRFWRWARIGFLGQLVEAEARDYHLSNHSGPRSRVNV